MRETLKIIEKEFESFFDFPTEDKHSVTPTSCKLFAEHCVEKFQSSIKIESERI